jgi:hypothetical protein
MKELVLPALALIALAAPDCLLSREELINPSEEAGKCEMVQTVMREPVPQRLLSGLMAEGYDTAQVLVFVLRPEQGQLERLFAGTPTCRGVNYKVVDDITMKAIVLFLQPQANGYIFDAQLSTPNELSLGTEAKGKLSKRDDGGWVASSLQG